MYGESSAMKSREFTIHGLNPRSITGIPETSLPHYNKQNARRPWRLADNITGSYQYFSHILSRTDATQAKLFCPYVTIIYHLLSYKAYRPVFRLQNVNRIYGLL